MTDYSQLVLKEYKYWTLGLSEKQYYLGRAYAWLKRPGEMQRLSQLHPEEWAELFEAVLPEYEVAAKVLFKPDHMNYAWLGNEFVSHKGHGHMHLIPRYKGNPHSRYANVRSFGGHTFADDQWGRNYTPYPKEKFDGAVLFKIRDALRKKLGT